MAFGAYISRTLSLSLSSTSFCSYWKGKKILTKRGQFQQYLSGHVTIGWGQCELSGHTWVHSFLLTWNRWSQWTGLYLDFFQVLSSASHVAQMVKNPPAVWETWVWFLGWEAPLENGVATHSSIQDCIVHGVAKSQTQQSDFHFSLFFTSYKNKRVG